jgi:hypothetical protein
VRSLFPIGLLIFYQLGFVGCLLDIDTAIQQFIVFVNSRAVK